MPVDPYIVGLGSIIIGAIAVLTWIGMHVWPVFQKLARFIDDIAGEPARPGVPARKGIMERLATVEDDITTIRREVKNSHDTNLREDLDDLRDAQAKTADFISELHKTLQPKVDDLHSNWVKQPNNKD